MDTRPLIYDHFNTFYSFPSVQKTAACVSEWVSCPGIFKVSSRYLFRHFAVGLLALSNASAPLADKYSK